MYSLGVLYENYSSYEKYTNFTSSTASDINPACSLNLSDLFLWYTEVEDNISVQELKDNIWQEIPAIPRERRYV